MPEMDDVIFEETIEVEWGNAIRDRTVQRYASSTQRDTEHATPAEGDLSYLEDEDAIHVFDGANWVTPIGVGEIDTAELAADAVTGAKIADDAVDTEHIAAGAVDTAELAADAVTNAKIAASAVDTAQIADDAVTEAKIVSAPVDTQRAGTNSNTVLTTTFADVVSFTFSIPADWNTYEILAWGSVIVEHVIGGGGNIEARARIAGAVGVTMARESHDADTRDIQISSSARTTGRATDVQVAMQARKTASADTATATSADVECIAVRKS